MTKKNILLVLSFVAMFSFSSCSKDEKPESNNNLLEPTLLNSGKTVNFGFYPQSYVSDSNLISSLNALNKTNEFGWYSFGNEFYTKLVASPDNEEAYTFNDGVAISLGETYWFKCEPISWSVLKNENNTYFLLSDVLLDNVEFSDNLSNNYSESKVRTFLNETFFNKAFDLFKKNLIVKNNIQGNSDNVFLLSVEDYQNQTFGFINNASRVCKTTDYTRAKGIFSSKETDYKNNGIYWTSSKDTSFTYASKCVNTGGIISTYMVDALDFGIRPAIKIKIN